MLRSWGEIAPQEQDRIRSALCAARQAPTFRWPLFAYKHNVRVWSLRWACDQEYRERGHTNIHRDEAPARVPNTVAATLTAAVFGDPVPGRSALDLERASG